MKKGLFLVGALIAVSFASCKKDFTCECTNGGVTFKYILKESKKSAAYAVCEGKGIGSTTTEDGTAFPDDSNCSIK